MSEFSSIFDKYRPPSSSSGGFYTPQLYNYEEQEDEDNGVQSSDYFYRLMQGGASVGEGIGYLLKKAGADSVGQTLQDAGESAVDYWGQKLSKEAQRIGQTEYTSGDLSAGDFVRKATLDAASSLLGTMAGMGAGGVAAKGITFLVPKVPSIAAGMLGYGSAEGAIGAGQSGANVESYIKNAKHTDLMQHPDYKATYLSFLDKGMNEQESELQTRKIAMDAAAGQASAETFITTALLSAPMGALVGKFASGIPLHATRARAIGTGMAGEAAQEFGQSGTEQIAQNRAIRDYADPNRELTKGALEAAVGGAVGGGLMGGLLGTRTPLESPEQRRDEPPPGTVDQFPSIIPPEPSRRRPPEASFDGTTINQGRDPGTDWTIPGQTPPFAQPQDPLLDYSRRRPPEASFAGRDEPFNPFGELQSPTSPGIQPPPVPGLPAPELFGAVQRSRLEAERQGADPLGQTLAAGQGLLGGVARLSQESRSLPEQTPVQQAQKRQEPKDGLEKQRDWTLSTRFNTESGARLAAEQLSSSSGEMFEHSKAGDRFIVQKKPKDAEYADSLVSMQDEESFIPESRMGGARSPEPPQADYEGIQLDEDAAPATLQDKTKLQPDKHLERRNQLERMKERTSQALNAYQLEVDKLKAAASNFGGEQAAPELDPDPIPGPQQAIEDRYKSAMDRVNAIPDQEQPKPAQERQEEAKPQSVMDRLANLPEVRHTVNTGKNKGKEIVGVVDKEITKEEAQAIDKYAFRHKDGGWFIRKDRIAAPAEEASPQLSSSGKPFATEREAGVAAKSRENRTGVRPEVVPVEGGFGLKDGAGKGKSAVNIDSAPDQSSWSDEEYRGYIEREKLARDERHKTGYYPVPVGSQGELFSADEAENYARKLVDAGLIRDDYKIIKNIDTKTNEQNGFVVTVKLDDIKKLHPTAKEESDYVSKSTRILDELEYYPQDFRDARRESNKRFEEFRKSREQRAVPDTEAVAPSTPSVGRIERLDANENVDRELPTSKVVDQIPEKVSDKPAPDLSTEKGALAELDRLRANAEEDGLSDSIKYIDGWRSGYKPGVDSLQNIQKVVARAKSLNESPMESGEWVSVGGGKQVFRWQGMNFGEVQKDPDRVSHLAQIKDSEGNYHEGVRAAKAAEMKNIERSLRSDGFLPKNPDEAVTPAAAGPVITEPQAVEGVPAQEAPTSTVTLSASGKPFTAKEAQAAATIKQKADEAAKYEAVPVEGGFGVQKTPVDVHQNEAGDEADPVTSSVNKDQLPKFVESESPALKPGNTTSDALSYDPFLEQAIEDQETYYIRGKGGKVISSKIAKEIDVRGLKAVVVNTKSGTSPFSVLSKKSGSLISSGKTAKEAELKALELSKFQDIKKASELDESNKVSQSDLRDKFNSENAQESKASLVVKHSNKSSVNVLRKAAESLDKKADAELGKERRTHTRRMAAQASSAINSANRQKEKAQIIRTVADHVESNPDSPLRAIKSVQDLDYIAGLVSPSRLERNGAPKNLFDHRYNASNQAFSEDVIKEDASTDELIRHVKKKETSVPSDWMKAVEKHLSENRNAKLAERIRRYSNTETGDNNFVSMAPIEDVEQLESALTKADPSVRRRIFGEDVLERIKDRKRRDRLGLGDDSNAKAMAKAYLELVRKKKAVEREETETEKKLKDSELRGKYKGTEFFNTPEKIARQVVSSADIEAGMSVLEPSAGIGHLAKAVAENTDKANIDVVELVPEFQSRLEKEGFNVIGSDFLELSPETHTKRYDRIVMNPPFSKDQDIAHIKHAFKFLKPGGRLVSIASSMAGERQNNANKDFKNWIEDLGGTQEMLPEAAFKDAINSTGVSAKMIVVDAPESVKPLYSSQPRPSGFKSISRKDLESAISPILKELGQTVKIVDSIADLPDEVRAGAQGLSNLGKIVPGVWHNGTYYAVVDQTQSTAMAVRTALHELVGHKGVLGVLGKDATAVLADIAKSIPADMRAQLIEDYTREDGTKPGEVELGAEYVARLAERNQRPGIVARAVSSIRAHLRKWFPSISWSKEDVLRLLEQSRKYLERGVTSSSESFFNSKKAKSTDSLTSMFWRMLAMDDSAFQTARTSKKDMEDIASDIDPEIKVSDDSKYLQGQDVDAVRLWSVTMADGNTASAMENSEGEVWIDASQLKSGFSGGTRLYAIVAAYAHNNKKVFIGDPRGLSDEAVFRRTENMLSSALKYKTTEHLRPHNRQKNPDKGVKGIASPMDWGDDYEENLAELLETSYQNIVSLVPEVKNVIYSVERQRFETLEGAAVDDDQFRRMAKDAYREYRGKISGASEGARGSGPLEEMLYGSASLKRAALTNTLVQESTPEGRRQVLSAFGTQLSGAVELPEAIKGTLYNSVTPRSIEESINAASESRLDRAKDTLFDNKLTEGAKRAALGTLTLRQLADIGKRALPQIKKYVDVVNQMLTKRNQLAERAANKIDKWQAWATKNRPENEKLVDLMHETTIAGVDPADDFVELGPTLDQRIAFLERRILATHGGRDSATGKAMNDELKELRRMKRAEPGRKLKHGDLQKKWFELTQEAKDIYIEIRNEHKERRELFKDIILGRLESAKLANKDRKELLNAMKFRFELQDKQAPYFPLVRFGKYWVDAVDGATGERVSLRQETEREQRRVIENLEKDGHSVLKSGLDADHDADLDGVSMGFVTDLIAQLDDIKMADDKRQEVADTIYQSYLKSLVDRSMRKQNIHRKAIRGWDQDAIRGFADVTMKNSYQLARMGVMDKLSEQMESMRKDTKTGDPGARRLYNEMIKRHQWVMNPTNSPLSQSITSVGFLWMLGLSPASALINLTQTMTVGVPVLASKFKEAGFSGVASELAKAAKIFKIKDGRLDTSQITADEQAAVKAWSDSGLLDTTRTHDLAGLAEQGGYSYNSTAHKTMQVVASLFHRAEQFNREVTALAAFRLARKSNSQATAVRMAAELTWQSHFDYSNTNRARYMQNDFMKVATQFKQFSQNMTYYLLRNLHQSVKGATKAEKQEARRQLVGTLAITGAIGGISALPLAGLWALANAIFGDDDEPFDAEAETKAYLAKLMGKDAANWLIYGALGAGISPRVSLNGLWYRDASQELEGESLWSWYAQQAVGPVLGGVLPDAMEGSALVLDGQIGRGLEKILPKFSKDLLKAYRYSEEDARTRKGALVAEIDGWGIAAQAMGFTPSEITERYQEISAIKGYEQHIIDRRETLKNRFFMARRDGDREEMQEIRKQIRTFNSKYRGSKIQITPESLERSWRQHVRRVKEVGAQEGLSLRPSLKKLATQLDWAS